MLRKLLLLRYGRFDRLRIGFIRLYTVCSCFRAVRLVRDRLLVYLFAKDILRLGAFLASLALAIFTELPAGYHFVECFLPVSVLHPDSIVSFWFVTDMQGSSPAMHNFETLIDGQNFATSHLNILPDR